MIRLVDYLSQRTASVLADTVQEIRNEVPFYRSLPDETLASDVTRAVRRNYELVLTILSTGESASAEALAGLEESARERADEQVPVAAVIDAYNTGAGYWWRVISDLHEAGAEFVEGDLPRIGAVLFGWLRTATAAVLAGYEADSAVAPFTTRPGRTELLDALLAGGDHRAVADRFHLPVDIRYWAVAIAVDPSPDELDPAVSHPVATARKVRRLQRHLDSLSRGEALHSVAAGGGIALIPVRPTAHRQAVDDAADFSELQSRLNLLTERMDARTTCAVDIVRNSEIPAVVPQLRDLLTIAARRSPHLPVVRFADLAVEFQLSRPSRATNLTVARLSPIADDPVLWETLTTYVRSECSATATAEILHVHPNTVTYRLRKITELTGLNLSRPSDIIAAYAAVLAADSVATERSAD